MVFDARRRGCANVRSFMLHEADRGGWAEALERGRIVHFPRCPLPLPSPDDQDFLREGLAPYLRRKNVSYYPDAEKLAGLRAPASVLDRARRILRDHCGRVRDFLQGGMPGFTRGWSPGTSSFRPMEEEGRGLSPHASNELIHVDAGAYGATHGDRILRFFVNLNPSRERVWVSKGAFEELFRRHGAEAGLGGGELHPRLPERALGSLLRVAGRAFPMARVVDTSPYDRRMRRFHNWMKDTAQFQQPRTSGSRSRRSPPGWCSPTAYRTPASRGSTPWSTPSSSRSPTAGCLRPTICSRERRDEDRPGVAVQRGGRRGVDRSRHRGAARGVAGCPNRLRDQGAARASGRAQSEHRRGDRAPQRRRPVLVRQPPARGAAQRPAGPARQDPQPDLARAPAWRSQGGVAQARLPRHAAGEAGAAAVPGIDAVRRPLSRRRRRGGGAPSAEGKAAILPRSRGSRRRGRRPAQVRARSRTALARDLAGSELGDEALARGTVLGTEE